MTQSNEVISGWNTGAHRHSGGWEGDLTQSTEVMSDWNIGAHRDSGRWEGVMTQSNEVIPGFSSHHAPPTVANLYMEDHTLDAGSERSHFVKSGTVGAGMHILKAGSCLEPSSLGLT